MTLVPSFPLLARELTERAAQRRTYVLRVIYAVLLFAPFIAAYIRFAKSSNVSAFGLGRQLFEVLTGFQFGGIYFLLPAIMCTAITREKERDSLSLLLLTRLTPGEIVLQKYFGGLMPMFSFLLLSLPLAALAYGMGGLGLRDLALGALLLVLAALQTAAIALLASVWSRSSAGSILLAFPLCFLGLLLRIAEHPSLALSRWLHSPWMSAFERIVFPPFVWVDYWSGFTTVRGAAFHTMAGLSIPLLLLFCARQLLAPRAFLLRRRRVRQFASRFNGLARRVSCSLGTMIFPHDERSLPWNNPIAWLESTRSALAHPDHVVRLALLLECLAGPFALGLALLNSRVAGLEILFLFSAGLTVLTAAMLGANAFVTERVKQTLEVLLTTPVSVLQMVREKASIVYRLMVAGLVPVGTVIAIAVLHRITWHDCDPVVSAVGGLAAIGAFMIGVPLVWWLALGFSIRTRARLSGMLAGLGGVLAVLALPSVALLSATLITGRESETLYEVAVLFSPLEMLRMIAGHGRTDLPAASQLALPFLHLGIFGALLGVVRQRCLRRAEHYLRG